jgi:hypothetical protein
MKEPIVVNSTGLTGFELLKRSLKEATTSYPYVMGRRAVRKVMLAPTWKWFSFRFSIDGEREHADGLRTANSIRLGCMRFTGSDYTKLRRWALAARRKS